MVVMTDVAGDSRVLREASALAAAGHNVHVIGKDVPLGWIPPSGVTVSTTTPGSVFRRPSGTAPTSRSTAGRRLPAPLRVARWALLPRHNRSVRTSFAAGVRERARGVSFDVLHAHDYTALGVGAQLAAERGATLIYDSHELWTGRARHGRPTPWQHRAEARAEDRLARQASAVITVSDSLAERLRARGWPEVRVVRNTFPAPAQPPRPPSEPRGVLYAGRIGPGRDLDTVIAASLQLAPLRTVLAGPDDRTWLAGRPLGGAELAESRPLDGVDDLLRELGLAIVTLEDSCENHRVALPNKLFHAVRAGIPVVAADLPELRHMVTGHGLGTLYTPGDPASLVAAVRQAVADYPGLLEGVRAAAAELSWEHDAAVLVDVYHQLLQETR